MQIQTIILIALAINLVIAVAAVAIPRLRYRRSAGGSVDAAIAGSGSVVSGNAVSSDRGRPQTASASRIASEPWFPGRTTESHPGAVVSTAASIDPATGLELGPAWGRWLREEDARVRRFHHPATIVLVELTGLDRLAERLGDDAAGRLIPPIAATMRRNARATDHLARLGPTRFGAILTETDEIRAINFIERVRSACDVWLEAGAVMLRLSVGWAEMSPDRPPEVALPDAEGRLYEERERTWAFLARQSDEPEVETGILQPAQA